MLEEIVMTDKIKSFITGRVRRMVRVYFFVSEIRGSDFRCCLFGLLACIMVLIK